MKTHGCSIIDQKANVSQSPKRSELGQFLKGAIPHVRGRQMQNYKPTYLENTLSNYSTCDTKHKQRVNKNNIRPKATLRKNNQISPSFSDSFYSESDSMSSYEYRKKKFLEEDTSFTNPTKKDVGLNSSEEDSSEFESPLKENLENEIERVLIEIYNKNISNCNYNNNSKMFCICDKISNYRLKKNKGLSHNKNEKYCEKILEIPEISVVYSKFKAKKVELNQKGYDDSISNRFILRSLCNSTAIFKPNRQATSLVINSSAKKKNLLITSQPKITNDLKKEITEGGITKILIRELINIKHTLKRSSYEIQQIFKYPLSHLKQKFSVEKIHLEAFNKILLNHEFISTLILQIKLIYDQLNAKEILELISKMENDKNYKCKEMTLFDKEISRYNGRDDILGDSISGNEINEYVSSMKKNTTPTSSSSIDYQKKSEENKINSDIDLDELVKYIDSTEESTHKKKKKKKNRGKKGNQANTANNNNTQSTSQVESKEETAEFDIEIKQFKEDIDKYSIKANEFQKFKPMISQKWICSLQNMY